ncbi:MAG: PAS domain-containing protein [Gemmatimonadetes bacterium]|nr:PAS domain-containing protein [Gemmatimonadota bacterium]
MDSPAAPPDRLMAVLEALATPAVAIGPDDRLLAANAAARARCIIDARAPLASQSAAVALQPVGRAWRAAVDEARQGADATTHTVPWDDRGHGTAWCDLRAAQLPDGTVLVTLLDVTERETRRDTIARLTREFETLFEIAPAAVRLVDASGRIMRANHHALTEHAGPTPTTVRELWELDAPHDVDAHRPLAYADTPAVRAFAGLTVVQQRLEVRRHGALRRIEAYATPLRDEAARVTGVLLFDCDVTAQVQHDADVEQQVRERRLAAIGQLAAGVMHDVNNALHPIMAAAYLLRHHAESPDAVRDYADRIRAAAEMGAATASRVGRFIRQEPVHGGGEEDIELAVLAEEVLDLTEPFRLQRSSESGAVEIVREFTAGLRVRVVPGEIREALLNLVQNAIDAMPGGGTLTVRTWSDGADACIAVRDTGTGMTAEVRERAFEPFFSTKGARGTGLGLAEVYGIVRRHRGTATISSEPGRGTEVVLRLPAQHPVEVRGPAPDAAPATVDGAVRPLRILVVEDHDDGREFLRRILEGDGHTVEAVGTLADARARLLAGSIFDLLLTDVGLPDGSGWEAVRLARTQLPTVRVGVITGWEPSSAGDDARDAEFVLRKPLRAGELKAHIAGSPAPVPPPD